jgi:hypothetical protein
MTNTSRRVATKPRVCAFDRLLFDWRRAPRSMRPRSEGAAMPRLERRCATGKAAALAFLDSDGSVSLDPSDDGRSTRGQFGIERCTMGPFTPIAVIARPRARAWRSRASSLSERATRATSGTRGALVHALAATVADDARRSRRAPPARAGEQAVLSSRALDSAECLRRARHQWTMPSSIRLVEHSYGRTSDHRPEARAADSLDSIGTRWSRR